MTRQTAWPPSAHPLNQAFAASLPHHPNHRTTIVVKMWLCPFHTALIKVSMKDAGTEQGAMFLGWYVWAMSVNFSPYTWQIKSKPPSHMLECNVCCPDSALALLRWILQSTPLHEDRPIFSQARGAAWPMPGGATTGSLHPQPDAASVSHTGPSQDSRPCQAAGPDAGPFWVGQLGFKLGHCYLAPKDSHHAQLKHCSNSFHFQHKQQPHQQ